MSEIYTSSATAETINRAIDNIMGLTTAYSFLMSLLRTWKQDKFTSQDIIDVLSAFKVYQYRPG